MRHSGILRALMTRAFLLAGLIVLGVTTEVAGQARTIRIQSESLGLRTAAVLLPTGYEESGERYPVLYLLHGGGQDHTAFMARPGFAKRARQVEMIVVMPAADRGALSPGAVERYETFLARELVPYVDANYRTLSAAPGRAVAGLSMGGMFAAGTASRYPAVFGTAGAFSAAFRTESAPPPPAAGAPYFYLSCGTLDSLLPAGRRWVELLKTGNVAHEYHEISGIGHSWDLWDPQIDAFVRLLASRPGFGARPVP